MIKQLQRIVEERYDNGTQLTRLPNNQEMMDKINEIIYVVNNMEKAQSNLKYNSSFDNTNFGTRKESEAWK